MEFESAFFNQNMIDDGSNNLALKMWEYQDMIDDKQFLLQKLPILEPLKVGVLEAATAADFC